MSFGDFFCRATGHQPYPYQQRLAVEDWPELLNIPTGLGKTAAVTLAWAWKRALHTSAKREGEPDPNTPRRLVWCLPMRVLVEQTAENVKAWLSRLGWLDKAGRGKVSVHLLMGGEDDLKSWAEWPEEEMVLIGTQDMLLSRALMRGYGMSRYQWPVHFAFLHNDALWVLDEVQLMGAGLATSAQVEAFRRTLPLAKPTRTLWVSATLNRDWLATVDFRSHLDGLPTFALAEEDQRLSEVRMRIYASKALQRATTRLTTENNRSKAKEYLNTLVGEILEARQAGSTTLVVMNRVERAQGLYRLLQKRLPLEARLLLHARFRSAERRAIEARLKEPPPPQGRVIVATQAIEAGVDITSKTLFTELAPWPSLVQRFGRCNRHGEYSDSNGARVFWIEIADDLDLTRPYSAEDLLSAREKLRSLDSASSATLPHTDEAAPIVPVLRRRDFVDLFNTDRDLSGFDVDISDYIRDPGQPQLAVFWRHFNDPNEPGEISPDREELCPISIGQAQALKKMDKWRWDSLARRWVKLDAEARPGITLLLRAADGGYDPEIGFTGEAGKPVTPLSAPVTEDKESYEADWRSRQKKAVELADHLGHVAGEAARLCNLVGEVRWRESVIRAGRWHDVGKSHPAFQFMLCKASPRPEAMGDRLWAKSDGHGRPVYAIQEGDPPRLRKRRYFRHELASMLAWLRHGDKADERRHDLIAYLICAHHGKVRMSLRAMPDEPEAPDGRRYARGVWEGDRLPTFAFDGETLPETRLQLAVMELGEGEQGPSWTARTQRLLAEHGPFLLGWLEALVRIADWRATAEEQLEQTANRLHNQSAAKAP